MSVLLNLSGILPAATKVSNQGKTTQKPAFEIDKFGNIDVNSMKGGEYYSVAQKYDTNHDGVLKLGELKNFLEDSKISRGNIFTGYPNRTVYYQETDEKGNITKRAYYGKMSDNQYVYTYKDGVPVSCGEQVLDDMSEEQMYENIDEIVQEFVSTEVSWRIIEDGEQY